ncbi:hypothetical protein PM082_006414 [Marasmius tenuissimus]|nr:hypothetical protein PM082_006414 [Marasmius tenuissimus]
MSEKIDEYMTTHTKKQTIVDQNIPGSKSKRCSKSHHSDVSLTASQRYYVSSTSKSHVVVLRITARDTKVKLDHDRRKENTLRAPSGSLPPTRDVSSSLRTPRTIKDVREMVFPKTYSSGTLLPEDAWSNLHTPRYQTLVDLSAMPPQSDHLFKFARIRGKRYVMKAIGSFLTYGIALNDGAGSPQTTSFSSRQADRFLGFRTWGVLRSKPNMVRSWLPSSARDKKIGMGLCVFEENEFESIFSDSKVLGTVGDGGVHDVAFLDLETESERVRLVIEDR